MFGSEGDVGDGAERSGQRKISLTTSLGIAAPRQLATFCQHVVEPHSRTTASLSIALFQQGAEYNKNTSPASHSREDNTHQATADTES
jgi:hypothetical protein